MIILLQLQKQVGNKIILKSYKFIISGKVQGVYYRVSVKKKAFNAKYNGYVKNLSNGTVEAGVTCTESTLNDFVKILREGSTKSNVTNIKKLDCDEIFTNKFEVR